MSNTVDTAALNNLSSVFRTAITTIIDSEKQPVTKLQSQRDEVNVRKGIYNDMSTNLTALQNSLHSLISTQASYSLNSTNKATVTPATANTTVLTATASSDAIKADYQINVTQLAKAQSKASAKAVGSDLALGKSGIFWMGGNGTASASVDSSDIVTGVQTSDIDVDNDQRELGTGTYRVEIKGYGKNRQFRLVNQDGSPVSIKKVGSDNTYTNGWQKMIDGSVNTGRGFTFDLSSAGSSTYTEINYTARGTSFVINGNNTLSQIAEAINDASQPEGHDFKASVVNSQLVLTSAQSGENHAMIFTDNAGLGFGADLQSAQNAIFSVNGLTISRPTNTNITDAINDVTINLAGDAEGKSISLSIGEDFTNAKKAVDTFVTKYNDAVTYLTQKMAITSTTDGDKTSYTRGPLTGDMVFTSLRQDLLQKISGDYTNTGKYHYLSEIGFSLGNDLKLTIDSSKLEQALQSNYEDTMALLDTAMGKFDQTLSTYTGSTGSLSNSILNMENQIKGYDSSIERYNYSITQRENGLISQYTDLQSQILELSQTASLLGININTSS
jgi:flagellar hook-associated protein 2